MSKKFNQNALVHGVYSSDIVLPWERAEDFNELLQGIRSDFKPNGTTEDDIVFEIADLHWKKRRINRALQLAFLQSSVAAEIEKSGKRSVSGIRRFFKKQRINEGREQRQFAAAVVSLSEATTSLADCANSKKKLSKGKLAANLRSVISEIEGLRPHIEAAAKPQAEEKVADSGYGFDTIAHGCEMEERLDALIEKKIKRLIIIREFQRQYGQDSNVKLIEHRASTAKDLSSKPSVAKPTVAKVGRSAQTEKSKGGNDNWNDDNNADNDNNEVEYDWDHEYVEAQAEKKARKERRARKD